MTGKKVAIIGAGKAGLVSAKYALEHGLKPVVFEKSNQIGGLWSRNLDTAIWNGLFTNVSKYTMMFHDHPWPKNAPIFNPAENVHEYLKTYSKKFNLNDKIQLNTKVESVKQLSNNKWELSTVDSWDKKTEIFDNLIIASGLHSKPRIPKISNSSKISGLQIHSSQFKLNDPKLKDKKVIILGCSLSGSEIAASLVGHAKSIVNIFPRTYLITPRLVTYKLTSDTGDKYKILPIDLFFNRRAFNYPDAKLSKKESEQIKLELFKRLFPYQTNKDKCHFNDLYVDLNQPNQEILIAISDYYLRYVQEGKIRPIKSRVLSFENESCALENGENLQCDVVVYCTGYNSAIDYLETKILDILKYDTSDHKFLMILYKCTFHPELENLALIGQTDGTFYCGDELQANWANMVFSGKRKLPKKELMLEEIDKETKRREKNRRSQYPYGNYVSVCDKLAKENAQLPNFGEIKQKNEHLYELLWNSGVNSNHYFLNEKMSIDVMNEIFEMDKREFQFEKKFQDLTLEDAVREFSKYYKLPDGIFKI
ncbi:unnamed protein product [Brachionus calyciflorus]|uniref:Flavin-containing monooxygenase n=1 Tax=Brachionus calyciflorus TaxID=104777 RepID=A0A813WSW6_9BILA|nr:unnamed protein product [Brachionus calyciflorus]